MNNSGLGVTLPATATVTTERVNPSSRDGPTLLAVLLFAGFDMAMRARAYMKFAIPSNFEKHM